jgi:hypothetical protein
MRAISVTYPSHYACRAATGIGGGPDSRCGFPACFARGLRGLRSRADPTKRYGLMPPPATRLRRPRCRVRCRDVSESVICLLSYRSGRAGRAWVAPCAAGLSCPRSRVAESRQSRANAREAAAGGLTAGAGTRKLADEARRTRANSVVKVQPRATAVERARRMAADPDLGLTSA